MRAASPTFSFSLCRLSSAATSIESRLLRYAGATRLAAAYLLFTVALTPCGLFPLKVSTRDRRIGRSESERRGEEKGREMRLTRVECDAAMYGRTATLLFAIALAGLAGGIAIASRTNHRDLSPFGRKEKTPSEKRPFGCHATRRELNFALTHC